MGKGNKPKTSRQIERHLKGVANYHRIEILFLIANNPGVTLGQIARDGGTNINTTGEHVRRLSLAGLVDKNYRGRFVEHSLSPYGRIFLEFLTTFQHL